MHSIIPALKSLKLEDRWFEIMALSPQNKYVMVLTFLQLRFGFGVLVFWGEFVFGFLLCFAFWEFLFLLFLPLCVGFSILLLLNAQAALKVSNDLFDGGLEANTFFSPIVRITK